jgi:hypothetical protein
MKRPSLSYSRIALMALILGLAPAAAMAYIDPGSGAYMVQVLFTLAAAAFFYVRHPIRSLRAFWGWVTKNKTMDSHIAGADSEGAQASEQDPVGDLRASISSDRAMDDLRR